MAERTVFQSISQKRVLTVPPHATVREAACAMTRVNCGSVLVIEPPDKLLGILTERDLMTRVVARGVDPERTTARDVMTAAPICVPPEMPVSEAVVIMLERGFRHLPIVNAHGRILGVFSIRDALPREIGAAIGIAEFNEQVNDALG
jgi:CBS domain-containing protein